MNPWFGLIGNKFSEGSFMGLHAAHHRGPFAGTVLLGIWLGMALGIDGLECMPSLRFQGSAQFLTDRFLGVLLQVGKEHVQFELAGYLDSAHHSR